MSPVLKKRISQQKIVRIFEEMYERPTIDMMGEDEGNMLYVALTRAKRNLIINDALFFLLTSCYINYSFQNLEFCSNCEETNCMKCGMDWRGLERTGEDWIGLERTGEDWRGTNILPRWSPVKMRELNYISSVVKLC